MHVGLLSSAAQVARMLVCLLIRETYTTRIDEQAQLSLARMLLSFVKKVRRLP
jgi:hypothetical protein